VSEINKSNEEVGLYRQTLVSVHKVLSLVQNVHFQVLRFKINAEFTSVSDHLFYEHNLPAAGRRRKWTLWTDFI
jgi:hypothetical protein